MKEYQFLKYESTPGEKHLGVATIKAFGRIVLRYKIVPTKDGSGFFPASASYKMTSPEGEDIYLACFLIYSRSDEEEIVAFIKANVKASMARASSERPSELGMSF